MRKEPRHDSAEEPGRHEVEIIDTTKLIPGPFAFHLVFPFQFLLRGLLARFFLLLLLLLAILAAILAARLFLLLLLLAILARAFFVALLFFLLLLVSFGFLLLRCFWGSRSAHFDRGCYCGFRWQRVLHRIK